MSYLVKKELLEPMKNYGVELRQGELPMSLPKCPFCDEAEDLSIRWYMPESERLGKIFQMHCYSCGATGPRGWSVPDAMSKWKHGDKE